MPLYSQTSVWSSCIRGSLALPESVQTGEVDYGHPGASRSRQASVLRLAFWPARERFSDVGAMPGRSASAQWLFAASRFALWPRCPVGLSWARKPFHAGAHEALLRADRAAPCGGFLRSGPGRGFSGRWLTACRVPYLSTGAAGPTLAKAPPAQRVSVIREVAGSGYEDHFRRRLVLKVRGFRMSALGT